VHALLASIEVALLAVMELVGNLHANLTLTTALKMGQSQFMLVVASLQRDWFALKAVADTRLVTVVAAKAYNPLLLAPQTVIVPILRPRHII
jgi:hypothetical protein